MQGHPTYCGLQAIVGAFLGGNQVPVDVKGEGRTMVACLLLHVHGVGPAGPQVCHESVAGVVWADQR